MAIRFFDMFAGIGGFRSGLEAVGVFECIGHCEIDKRTNMAYCAIYDTEGEFPFILRSKALHLYSPLFFLQSGHRPSKIRRCR